MNFIDTHTHLFLEQFDEDRDATVKNAIEKGVTKMILPNVDSEKTHVLKKMAKDYPGNIFPLMGLHPSSVKENYKQELKFVEKELSENNYFGIGEIGIDLYWDKTFFKQQVEAFRYQIALARKNNLPIVIHVRNSFDETFEVLNAELKENGNLPTGIFHCFTGNYKQAQQALNLGFFLGIGGVLTFKNSGLNKIVEKLPLSRIVLETDSPYLAPTPFRGKRNESSYIPLIAQKLSDVHQVPIKKVAEITSKNAESIFNL